MRSTAEKAERLVWYAKEKLKKESLIGNARQAFQDILDVAAAYIELHEDRSLADLADSTSDPQE